MGRWSRDYGIWSPRRLRLAPEGGASPEPCQRIGTGASRLLRTKGHQAHGGMLDLECIKHMAALLI
jgi:hypothetical protein